VCRAPSFTLPATPRRSPFDLVAARLSRTRILAVTSDLTSYQIPDDRVRREDSSGTRTQISGRRTLPNTNKRYDDRKNQPNNQRTEPRENDQRPAKAIPDQRTTNVLSMPTRRTLRQRMPTRYHDKAHRNKNGEDANPPSINDAERASPIQTRSQPSDDDNASPSWNDDDTRTQRVQTTNKPQRHSGTHRSSKEREDDYQCHRLPGTGLGTPVGPG